MRPHVLRVTAFGAFPGTVGLDLDALSSGGLFLLHGETGAGKSTLLDAIGFALYGSVPGERNRARRLRSDHAGPDVRTEVALDFSVGGRRWRVTRRPEQPRPKLRGTGTTTDPAYVLLEERDAAGWRAVSTRAGEADAEIARAVGMSADQFFQVVLLPQGEFARFLRANAEERGKVLERLFATDRFGDVERWLADRRADTARAVADLEQDVRVVVARVAQAAGVDVPAGPAVTGSTDLDWARTLFEQARAEAEAADIVALRCQAALEQAEARRSDSHSLDGRFRRRDQALAELDQLKTASDEIARVADALSWAQRAAEIGQFIELADQAKLASATADAEAGRRQAATVRCGAPGNATQSQLVALAAEARRRTIRLEALLPEVERAHAERRAAADHRAAADLARARSAVLDAELAILPDSRRAAVERRDAAADAGRRVADRRVELERVRAASGAAATLAEGLAAAGRLEQEHRAALQRQLELTERYQQIRTARFEGMIAELANKLADGDECPVCGATEHPAPYLSAADPVDKAEEEAAARAVERAAGNAARIAGELATSERDVGAARAHLAELGYPEATAADLTGALAELEAQLRALTRLAGEFDGAVAELDRLDLRDRELSTERAGLAEREQAAVNEAAAADRRAEMSERAVAKVMGDETDSDGATDVAAAITRSRALATACEAAADALTEATRCRTAAGDRVGQATAAATAAGFADLVAAREAARDSDWRSAAAARVRDHDAQRARLDALLASADLALDDRERPDVVAADAAYESAGRARDDARTVADRCAGRANAIAGLLKPLADLLDRLEPARADAAVVRGLADLAGGLGSNTLKMTLSSFVLAARLEEVAAVASQRLSRMTGGRYTLVHTDATRGAAKSGLGLLVRDAWTGQDRDTATLSGGETFMASLALALGLADVVAAESGGSRLEALFVDEGFGSLDEDTLDEVMDVLDGLREGGRIVGVVSHVAEMRARIPSQLRVHKHQHGSTVEVLAG